MLNLIQKLSTAMRGGTREVLESTIDANALRIFAQEIHECECNLQQAKQHLAGVMAEKLKLKRQLDGQVNKVKSSEAKVRSKLEAKDEKAALVLAEEMAQQETLLASLEQQYEKLQAYEQRLLNTLKAAAHKLEQRRAELRMAQATQHAQKAVGKVSRHVNEHSDTFSQMQDSMARIQRKQDDFDDRMVAMDEIDAQMSDEPTEKEEVRGKAEDILVRLKVA